jgi:uncharacterized protein YcaQ
LEHFGNSDKLGWMTRSLSARQARRIAIAAQGLAGERPARPVSRRTLADLAGRLGAIQIDSVNVLVRTHYLPAFSRLGAYRREALEAEAWGERPRLFEYWGHEASFLPIERQPLFRWRMDEAREGRGMWKGLARFARERRDYVDNILAEIERRGPVTGGDFADGTKRTPGWWSWSDGKRAIEWLFWSGQLMVKTRRGFERVYDLTERVLPAAIANAPTPSPAEAHRALILIAARAMGVATEADLRDYFRLPAAIKPRLAELVEAGALEPVTVEGWRQPAFLVPGARLPRKLAVSALLSPFDNLIWARERTERLFDVRVRLEIYTPAHKRAHGYYVLPFLQGEAITARVDLKADRAAGVLRVQSAHLEPGAGAGAVAPALAEELCTMAGWLGLADVAVAPKGDLAKALAAAVGA